MKLAFFGQVLTQLCSNIVGLLNTLAHNYTQTNHTREINDAVHFLSKQLDIFSNTGSEIFQTLHDDNVCVCLTSSL